MTLVTVCVTRRGSREAKERCLFDALVQVIEGEAEVTVAGTPIALRAGEVVLLPAEKPHAVKATERFKMVLTMVR